MTENEPNPDDERGLMARLLRKSADEIEQKADDEDDDDDEGGTEEKATPIDAALENGTINAAEASDLRPVAEKMDDDGVQTLVDAISENDLAVEEAVDLIEAVDPGDMPGPDDDGGDGGEAPEELKSAADEEPSDDADDGALDEAVEKLEAKLEAAEEVGDRIEEIEQKLDALEEDITTGEDIEQKLEQKLDDLGEQLDDEFEELLQKAEVVDSPNPDTGGEGGETTLGDVIRMDGGD